MMMQKATRDAYGEILVELGKSDPNIVVLDADLSSSTKTSLFAKAFPDRFFNMGIAEANMMGVAAGLARSGKTVFASTFAVFATGRVWDQIRQSIAYPRLNVKIVASHGGITVGPDGASHQALEDIALMRLLPGMRVVVPCDAEETRQVIRRVASYDGPVYVRLGREKVEDVLKPGTPFEFGHGLVLEPEIERDEFLKSEEPFDVALISCGIMVRECLVAAKSLRDAGINPVVLDFASIKPLDNELLDNILRRVKAVITAEEHSIIGGLGSAVCERACESHPVPVFRVGTNDVFGQSGEPGELCAAYGLTSTRVAELAIKALDAAR